MSDINLYKAYTDETVLTSNPLGLVIALYEGALDSIGAAKACFGSGDIAGRGKAINKSFAILTELMSSLDHKQGGEISKSLAGLYDYMQRRVLDAHLKKSPKSLFEVENLLRTMLDGWKNASSSFTQTGQYGYSAEAAVSQAILEVENEYNSYFVDHNDSYAARPAYSF